MFCLCNIYIYTLYIYITLVTCIYLGRTKVCVFTNRRKQEHTDFWSPPGTVQRMSSKSHCSVKSYALCCTYRYPTVSALGMSSLVQCQSVAAHKMEPNFPSPWSEWTSERLHNCKPAKQHVLLRTWKGVPRSANDQSWHIICGKQLNFKKCEDNWTYFISGWLFQAFGLWLWSNKCI